MEFHVTNTFTQTFLLIAVGYLTFFFDITNFTDKIMVSLTTMLVIATIVTANQAVSLSLFLKILLYNVLSIKYDRMIILEKRWKRYIY